MPNWAQIKYLLEIMRELKQLSTDNPTDTTLQKAKNDLIAEIKKHAT